MSITVTVENDMIKLLRVSPAERYAGLIGITDALPADMAENHDHYLHGAPRQG